MTAGDEADLEAWFDRIRQAAEILEGQAHHTPVVTSRTLDQKVGGHVFLKCENLQRGGAFKFRGAYHAISRLAASDRSRGVLTYSSGNHAQAVALAGRLLGVETTIVMPRDAAAVKREATAGYGARVVLHDPETTTRRQVAREIQKREGQTIIPPYDHSDIIAGQGTTALEIHQDVPELDLLLVPCGGGGLLSGCAIATKHLRPQCRVIGIEPEAGDDATRSFHTGRLHTVRNPQTIADGTRTPSLGELNFRLVRRYVDDMRTVGEEAIRAAVRFLALRLKLVVEPSGALPVAALLAGDARAAERTGVVLSGGNVDPTLLADILGRPEKVSTARAPSP